MNSISIVCYRNRQNPSFIMFYTYLVAPLLGAQKSLWRCLLNWIWVWVQSMLQMGTAVCSWKGTLCRAVILPGGHGPAVSQRGPHNHHLPAGLPVHPPTLSRRLDGMEAPVANCTTDFHTSNPTVEKTIFTILFWLVNKPHQAMQSTGNFIYYKAIRVTSAIPFKGTEKAKNITFPW